MIKIEKLTKHFHHYRVLDHIDMEVPRRGVIGIYGRSGSGKSTLLKILAGLIDFQGHIKVYQTELGALDDHQLSDYRLRDIGLIFQTYRLFEQETVAWNVALPLYLLGYNNRETIDKQVRQTLLNLGIESLAHRKVYTLSGGEKQRVAFARALIKQPRIILADEPTASLDEANKNHLMNLLLEASDQRLVMIVSHDQKLLKTYADGIYQLHDGKLHRFIKNEPSRHIKRKVSLRLSSADKAGVLPMSFCFRHAMQDMKTHKWRHIIGQSMLSIALLALGVGMQVTSSINSKVQATIHRLVGGSGMQLTSEQINNSGLSHIYAADRSQVEEIALRYRDYVSDIGVVYQTNIDDFFPDRNEIFVISEGPIAKLPSLSAQHLAEPLLFSELNLENNLLQDDEISLMLPETDIKILAMKIGTSANAAAINQGLSEKDIYIGAGFSNYSWSYEDEQMWRLVKVYESKRAHIVHSNARFNEFVLETSMRLPATTDLYTFMELPWLLRKAYFLRNNDPLKLMDILYRDLELIGWHFDHVSNLHMRTYCPVIGYCPSERIIVLINPEQSLSLAHLNYILDAEPRLSEPIITTRSGYFLYPESMFSGFVNQTFFAPNDNIIDQIIDWLSYAPRGQLSELPPFTAHGHYQDQSQLSVKLKQLSANEFIGRKPASLQEIAISKGLAAQIGLNSSTLGETLHMATRIITGENELGTISEFIKTRQVITAISADEELAIYGSRLWSVAYYRDMLGFFGEDLVIDRAYFSGEENFLVDSGRRIMASFPNLMVSFPQAQMRSSLLALTTNIDAGIFGLALIAGVNSLLLSSLILRLSWLDIVKDRILLFELGSPRRQIFRLLTARMIIIVGGALLSAIIQMTIVAMVIEKALSQYFNSGYIYRFPITAIVMMTLFCGIMFIVLSLVSQRYSHHPITHNS